MSVVLRCPACGTTRPTPGECEACHEASVRYFCTNHTPGVWVDGPTCPQCGARFGEAPRIRKPVPVPPTRPRRTAPPRPAAPARPTAPAPPSPSRDPWAEPPAGGDAWEPREESPRYREGGLPPGVSPLALLLNLLTASARGRHTGTVRPPLGGRPRGGAGLGCGCLIQVLFGILSLLAALFYFGGW